MKFKVKDEFAGRTSKCPTCKKPIAVPNSASAKAQPAPALVGIAGGKIAQAAAGGGVTLEVRQKSADKPIEMGAVKKALAAQAMQGERYIVQGEIARGGMGVVIRAVDSEIRREVALKFLLDQSNQTKTSRFIEEAQVTGQLEHPNIVPVHDLGMDAEKRYFFSMKMVRGRSLLEILDSLRAKDAAAEKRYTLGKLLNILVSVCNAMAYAHSLGVVHRDIKPANIMVGDFGEVYVMDWGLAKIMQGDEELVGESEQFAAAMNAQPVGINRDDEEVAIAVPVADPSGEVPPGGSSRVTTNRQHSETDLTVEGTIMGTPAYMPPEQALGRLRSIGPRSDIYSMGALLYEMLALQPPVDRDGGFQSMLLKVVEGKIVAPEKRNKARAREGKIPPDLSAIAMKALAREQAKRYGTAESMRRDIELYQEGRSVSAKEDTKTELMIKFVKRNKAICAAVALMFVILFATTLFGLFSTLRANRAFADAKKAQEDSDASARKAVPAMVDAARYAIERRQFKNALAQTKMALDLQSDSPEANLLHAHLLIALNKDFSGARKNLDLFVSKRPNDTAARELRDLCGRTDGKEPADLYTAAGFLGRHQMFILAEKLIQDSLGKDDGAARQYVLVSIQNRLEKDKAFTGFSGRLTLDKSGIFAFDLNSTPVAMLAPLQGLPITRLNIHNCQNLTDLKPLRDMPLESLTMSSTFISDLSPLEGARLTSLDAHSCPQVADLKPLKDMPLKHINLTNCASFSDVVPLAAMPLNTLLLQSTAVRKLDALKNCPLQTLNLRTCGSIVDFKQLAQLKMKSLDLAGTKINNLSDLQGAPLDTLLVDNCPLIKDVTAVKELNLATLSLANCGELQDIKPMAGVTMATLNLAGCKKLTDLTPLKDARITNLTIDNCTLVGALPPLAKMSSLTNLSMAGCVKISDLTPLQGTNLTQLNLTNCKAIEDVTPLQKAPRLANLAIDNCDKITDLTPLKDLPLTQLTMTGCKGITDVSMLGELKQLATLKLPTQDLQGMEILKKVKTLTTIDGQPATNFWKAYDDKKKKRKGSP
jgi:serine/threonine protein kinase